MNDGDNSKRKLTAFSSCLIAVAAIGCASAAHAQSVTPPSEGTTGSPAFQSGLVGPAINLPNHAQEIMLQAAPPAVLPSHAGDLRGPIGFGPDADAAAAAPDPVADKKLVADTSGSSAPPTSSGGTQFDLTPVKLPERGAAFGNFQSFKTGLLYKLPAQMFFSGTVENSLRCETNVLQTHNRNHADMVYRVLPNVTLGYAVTKKTRISANYFYFRDQYMDNNKLLSRNIHSVGFRGDHDFLISPRTTVTTSFFGRALFITKNPELTDLIPSATVVHRVGERGAVYSSMLGQVRWNRGFQNYQEFDQFYSFGGVYRLPRWSFLFDTTLIDNFGKARYRGGVASNHLIVMTMEAGRKVSSRLPLTAFVRAEPIFNFGQEKRTGFSGVNFRIFGGIRAELSKPAIFPIRLRGAG